MPALPHVEEEPPRALRAHDQKSNRPNPEIQNNSHAKSPAKPPPIKIRCAKMLKKAHHPSRLTEEDHARSTGSPDPKRPHGTSAPWRSPSLPLSILPLNFRPPSPPPHVCQI